MLRLTLAAVAALTTSSLAAVTGPSGISTQCPVPNLCFSLNIPSSTIESDSGDFYLQINGPVKNSWISIAQGNQMAGAHFFVAYTSANGSVTVSPRMSRGYKMPVYTPETQVEVLEGSGVIGDQLRAIIKCSNCTSWSNGGKMNLTSSTTSWIWAYKIGKPMHTDSLDVHIDKHSEYGRLTFDAKSHGGFSTNPFHANSPLHNPVAAPMPPGVHLQGHHKPPLRIIKLYTAHAVLACLAWTFIFPLGGIMIRILSFPKLLHAHAYLQLVGMIMYTAAVGLGIQLSINRQHWHMDDKHVIIGLMIFILFLAQGVTGWYHHKRFVQRGGRTWWSHAHLWSGRVCVTAGIVNGGLGFMLTGKGWETWEVKSYAVCGVLVWCAYVGSAIYGECKRAWMLEERKARNGNRAVDGRDLSVEEVTVTVDPGKEA